MGNLSTEGVQPFRLGMPAAEISPRLADAVRVSTRPCRLDATVDSGRRADALLLQFDGDGDLELVTTKSPDIAMADRTVHPGASLTALEQAFGRVGLQKAPTGPRSATAYTHLGPDRATVIQFDMDATGTAVSSILVARTGAHGVADAHCAPPR